MSYDQDLCKRKIREGNFNPREKLAELIESVVIDDHRRLSIKERKEIDD